MDVLTYFNLKERIIEAGYADDVAWAENPRICASADDFAREHAFVVCNSGMKAQIAVEIFRRVWAALIESRPIDDTIFRNKPKRRAMQYVYDNRERLFAEYNAAEDKIAYLETLPYIGAIIKFHLAKNFGFDCCKPDRHLVRVAGMYADGTPEALCQRLSEETGNNINTVDVVIWRAANLRFI
jgi:hypothetical protein